MQVKITKSRELNLLNSCNLPTCCVLSCRQTFIAKTAALLTAARSALRSAAPFAPADIAALLRLPPPAADPADLHRDSIAPGASVRDAAVLVLMVEREGHVNLLFTQRTEHLAAHAGQICFPGGRAEAADTGRDDTALRETEEEIGLARQHVTVLGALPEYALGTGFRITPVVGWIKAPFDTRPDPYEVAEIFELPLSHFIDTARYQRHEYHFNGRHRHYVAIPYEGRYIWGATAGMLLSLARVLSARTARTARAERSTV